LAGRQDGARLLASRVAASLAPEPRAVAARELLNDEEPGVVPGSLETGPGVPEPHHHVHGYSSAGSPSASSSSFSPTTSGSAASAASSSTTRGGTTATIASSRSSITCASDGSLATRSETCRLLPISRSDTSTSTWLGM